MADENENKRKRVRRRIAGEPHECTICRESFPTTPEYFFHSFNSKKQRWMWDSRCRPCRRKYLRELARAKHASESVQKARSASREVTRLEREARKQTNAPLHKSRRVQLRPTWQYELDVLQAKADKANSKTKQRGVYNRRLACALYEESKLSTHHIAGILGMSHQRVSQFLKEFKAV